MRCAFVQRSQFARASQLPTLPFSASLTLSLPSCFRSVPSRRAALINRGAQTSGSRPAFVRVHRCRLLKSGDCAKVSRFATRVYRAEGRARASGRASPSREWVVVARVDAVADCVRLPESAALPTARALAQPRHRCLHIAVDGDGDEVIKSNCTPHRRLRERASERERASDSLT